MTDGFLDGLAGLVTADGFLAFRLYIALVLAGSALFLVGQVMRRKMRGAVTSDSIPVTLRVIGVEAEPIRGRDDHVTFRPEFEITEGPYQGVRKKSDATSAPPIHEAGDTDEGYYDPVTGALESRSVLSVGTRVILLCRIAGAVLFFLGLLGLVTL